MTTIRHGWNVQDIISREDIVNTLVSNLSVVEHPIPDGTKGILYCVDGVSICANSIMELLESRLDGRKECTNAREETDKD